MPSGRDLFHPRAVWAQSAVGNLTAGNQRRQQRFIPLACRTTENVCARAAALAEASGASDAVLLAGRQLAAGARQSGVLTGGPRALWKSKATEEVLQVKDDPW